MGTSISIVTWNRQPFLRQTLDALERTVAEPDVTVYVTDNGSVDGTREYLAQWCATPGGRFRRHVTLLNENVGIAKARNAHWAHCRGDAIIRMDDKVKALTDGWVTAMAAMAAADHALVGLAYDPTISGLKTLAPIMPVIGWGLDHGIGGPLMYIPAEAEAALGAWDELDGVLYGWEDCLYIQRARLLGWTYAKALALDFDLLAKASEATRAKAQQNAPKYHDRLTEYREGERDAFIPVESTEGHRLAHGEDTGAPDPWAARAASGYPATAISPWEAPDDDS